MGVKYPMLKALDVWFPTTATRVTAAALAAILLTYLGLQVQLVGPMLFEIWHHAGRVIRSHAEAGLYDYDKLRPSWENYYKLSPSFTVFPMALFGPWPVKPAGAVFNVLNGLAAAAGILALLSCLRPPRALGPGMVALFVLLALFDLHINAAYGQVTGLLVGAMLGGIALYSRGHLLAAGILLAWAANVKLYPLVPALLLATQLKPRYLLGLFGGLLLWLLWPALVLGWTANLEFHKSLYLLLTNEKDFIYAPGEVHFHYGIRAFLQANFGLKMGGGFNLLPALVALVLAFGWWRQIKTRVGLPPGPVLALMIHTSFAFILLFNTRTEGPATVLMGAIYLLLLLQMLAMDKGPGRLALLLGLILTVFTMSLSTTDVGKVLGVNKFFWQHNLRTVPVLALMVGSTLALFHGPTFQFLCGRVLPSSAMKPEEARG